MKIRLLLLLLAIAGGLTSLVHPGSARADTVYVSNESPPGIEQFTPGGVASSFVSASAGLLEPDGLAFGSAGNLYVDDNKHSIKKITPAGAISLFANISGHSESGGPPDGLGFDHAGNLYVASAVYGDILKFTPGGVQSLFVPVDHANLTVGYLAFDANNNVYAAYGTSNSIKKFSSTGADLGVFASTGLSEPAGLAFDVAGNLYVANNSNNTIEKFSTSGVGTVFATDSGNHSMLDNPNGLAFDSAGNLYALNNGVSGQFIEKFTPGGVGSLFASTGLAGAGYIAISPGLTVSGDYNNNGIVDAADYVVWRKGLGTTYTQNDYNVWRANFGQTAGSGSGATASAAVPEPTTLVLLMFAAAGLCLRRRRSA